MPKRGICWFHKICRIYVLLKQAGMSWKYVSNDGVSIKLVILFLLNFKVSSSGFFFMGCGDVSFHAMFVVI